MKVLITRIVSSAPECRVCFECECGRGGAVWVGAPPMVGDQSAMGGTTYYPESGPQVVAQSPNRGAPSQQQIQAAGGQATSGSAFNPQTAAPINWSN